MSIIGETLILAGPQAVDGLIQLRKGKQAAQTLKDAELEIKSIMDNKEAVTNPFADVTNPYQNMGVATQAAEMQQQQTDQALANTLDTLRATGTSAGGATALARAAAQSKQGVAASIEAQEAKNQELVAKGEQRKMYLQGEGEMVRARRQEARMDEQIGFQEKIANRAYQEQVNRQRNAMASFDGILGAVSDNYGELAAAFSQRPSNNKTSSSGFGSYADYISNPDNYNVGFGSGGGLLTEAEFNKYNT